MRISIVDYAGHPFQAQLSRKLAQRGHDVLHLYFGQAITPRGMLTTTVEDPKTLDIEGVRLDGEFRKYSYVRRWWQEQLLAKAFVRRIERFRPEVVIVANAPLDIARAIQRRCISSGVPFILWQQDIYSVALATLLRKKLGVVGAAVARYYHRLEGKILALSDAVIVISPAFAALDTSRFGLSPDRIAVIRNWAPVDEIRPGERDNCWSRAQGVTDRKVVMYSGTLGSKHDPAILLRIAEHLSERGDAVLVVVSEGPNVRALEEQAEARRLAAIKFLPFQPYEDFPNVLASAIVLIGILEDEAGVFSVPSKVLSYLCSGRPILLCAPAENLASRVVLEAEAGAVYSTSRPQDLLSGLDKILNDDAAALRLGDNARRYAEMAFDIESIADRFLKVIANASRPSGHARDGAGGSAVMAKKARSGSGSAPDCQRLESAPERAAHEGLARQQTQANLPEVGGERRHLFLGAFGSSLLLSAPGALALTNGASAAAQRKPERRATTVGQTAAVPSYPLSLPLLRETYGAAGNGTDDDAQVLAALPAGAGALVGPGTYQVGFDVEIKGHLWFMPGAVLRPAAGVTVTFAAGVTITAGDYRIFDDSLGGTFRGGEQTIGWAKSSWFPGGNPRDLGVQINKALDWGFFNVDVPPAHDHVIRTTIRLRHASTVRLEWNNFPRYLLCETAGKPVFEAIGSFLRDWRIKGGFFEGAQVKTPSCFLLYGRDDTEGQVGDTTPISETHLAGFWGVATLINIASEIVVHQNCSIWNYGRGDFAAGTLPHASVIIANADYWGLPFAYTKPRRTAASTSAIRFDGCDIRGGLPHPTDPQLPGTGHAIILKGQAEDIDINGTYINGIGRSIILAEAGEDPVTRNVTSPRRVYIAGGRTENNKGTTWGGIPTIVVDALNFVGHGLFNLTIGPMSHYVGVFLPGNTVPIIRTERGAYLYAFTMDQGGTIEGTNRLIEHRTADLDWADVRCPFKVDIDCGTRALNDCDIKIGGRVVGAIGTGTKVRANNVQNW